MVLGKRWHSQNQPAEKPTSVAMSDRRGLHGFLVVAVACLNREFASRAVDSALRRLRY
jgi:hypothetical protein